MSETPLRSASRLVVAGSSRSPERGATWPLVVFLVLALALAPPALGLALVVSWGGVEHLARSFVEGGPVMNLLLVVAMAGIALCSVASCFYVVTRRLPASFLALPICPPVILGFLSAGTGVDLVDSARRAAAPDVALDITLRGLALGGRVVALGALVAASMAGLTGLLAACRAVARRPARPVDRPGVVLLLAGTVVGVCGVGATFLTSAQVGPPHLIGLAGLASIVCLGVTATRGVDDWAGGANRWLAALSGAGLVGLTWLAAEAASMAAWPGLLDQVAADQAATALVVAHGVNVQTELAGRGFMVAVAVVATASLALGGRAVLAGAARFRIGAGLSALLVVAAVGAAAWYESRERQLVRRVLESHPGTLIDRTEGFRPALSRHPLGLAERRPVVIVGPDLVSVDGQRVADIAHFDPGGVEGLELRRVLAGALDDARTARDAEAARLGAPVEALESRSGPRSGGGPRGLAVAVAVHREVSFGALIRVAVVLQQMDVDTLELLVRPSDHRSPPPLEGRLHELARAMFSGLGRVPVALDRGGCSFDERGPRDDDRVPQGSDGEGLALALRITNEGFVLSGNGGVLSAGCGAGDAESGPTVALTPGAASCGEAEGETLARHRARRSALGLGPPACAYDFRALAGCLRVIMREYPEEGEVIVTAGPTVDHQVLIRTLDVARGSAPESQPAEAGSPGTAGGEPWSLTVILLYVGDDLEGACHRPRAAAQPARRPETEASRS